LAALDLFQSTLCILAFDVTDVVASYFFSAVQGMGKFENGGQFFYVVVDGRCNYELRIRNQQSN
jgi:hypothetical protein